MFLVIPFFFFIFLEGDGMVGRKTRLVRRSSTAI